MNNKKIESNRTLKSFNSETLFVKSDEDEINSLNKNVEVDIITSSSNLANSENNLKSEENIINNKIDNNNNLNQQLSSKNINNINILKSDSKQNENLPHSQNLDKIQNKIVSNDKIKEMSFKSKQTSNKNNIKLSNSSSSKKKSSNINEELNHLNFSHSSSSKSENKNSSISKKSLNQISSNISISYESSSDYSNDSNESNETLKILKKKNKCTYFEYGNYHFFQKYFYCDLCDPNRTEKICNSCYLECHKVCRIDNKIYKNQLNHKNINNNSNIIIFNELDSINSQKIFEKNEGSFICNCGLKRHKLNKKNESIRINYCLFLELDYKLHNKAKYSCQTCNITNLCYICYLKCHSNCLTKKTITGDKNINKNKICLCKNNKNHSSRIILNKFINAIFKNKNNYDTIPYIWKCQILNCIFDGSIFELLYEKLFEFILKFNNKNFNEDNIDEDIIDILARFVININMIKEFYYIHNNLIKLLPMETLLNIINSFNDLCKHSNFISNLMNLFYKLHLKKDFCKKSLCYKDFLLTNCMERIIFRNIYFSNGIYNFYINKKYFIDDTFILPKICINFANLMVKSISQFDNKNFEKYIKNYVINLKIIYFCLKRFFLNKEDLIKLIEILEKFSNSFHINIKTLLTFNKNNIENLFNIENLINYLSKIIYIICINFNDYIVEHHLNTINFNKKYIEKNIDISDEKNINRFIHYISEHSKKIFKVLISCSLLYNIFILNLNEKINDKKNDFNLNNIKEKNIIKHKIKFENLEMINIVNQSLELFTLSDNNYYQKIKSLKLIDFKHYLFLNKYINSHKDYEETLKLKFEKKNIFDLEKDKIDYKIERDSHIEITSEFNEKNLRNSLIIDVYNLISKIESLFNLFFYSKIEFETIDNKLHDLLFNLGKNWTKEDTKLPLDLKNEKMIEFLRNKSIKKSNNFLQYKQTINQNNNKLKLKKYRDFNFKVLNLTKEFFFNLNPFIEHGALINENSQNYELNSSDLSDFQWENINNHITVILNELIFSNIDNTLTKFFIIDPIMHRYSERTITLILYFLLYYLLSKQGIMYFICGRTLKRLNSIFLIYPNITLKFLSILTEGIKLYNIDISKHKQIPNMLNNIYKYIKKNMNLVYDEFDQIKFNECIIYTMDILNNLSNKFEIENLNKIFYIITNEITKLISKQKIFNLFPFQKIISKYFEIKEKEIEIFKLDNEYFNNKLKKIYPKNTIVDNKIYDLSYLINKFNENKTSNYFPKYSLIKQSYYEFQLNEYNLNQIFNNISGNESLRNRRRNTLFGINKKNLNDIKSLKKMNLYNPDFIKKTTSKRVRKNFIKTYEIKNESDYENNDDSSSFETNSNYSNPYSLNDEITDGKITFNIIKNHSFQYQSKLITNYQNIFFSLINLLSNINFFSNNNKNLKIFLNINDLIFFKLILSENYLNLQNRIHLLKYIRMVYINDIIDENNIIDLNKYMNSLEYSENLIILREILGNIRINFIDVPLNYIKIDDDESKKKIEKLNNNNAFNRFININNLKIVIEIFIHEINNMLYYIYTEKNILIINEYITEILFSFKFICDTFISYNICSHLDLWFYEIVKAFLPKINFFINYYKNIKEKGDISFIEINEKINKNMKEIRKKTFNIYDNEKIYGIALESFVEIYNETKFNEKFKLSKFIKKYKIKDEKNFKNFTLNKSDIPFYIFDVSNDNEDSFLIDDKKFLIFQKITEIYLYEFSNFFSTAFYDLLCNTTSEINLNYKEIFLNYCVEYIYNLKYLPSENLVNFLTMLNKLLIYDTIGTQKGLSKIFEKKNKIQGDIYEKNKKEKYLNNKEQNIYLKNNNKKEKKINNSIPKKFEEIFFNNLVIILKEKININMAICKNIIISKRYESINYTTKILIQFFQLLGEGHNKDFHNLIITGQINQNNKNFNSKENDFNVFKIMTDTLYNILLYFDNYENLILKGELPFDKLLVLCYNILSFIIEYFQGTSMDKYKVMYDYVKKLFPIIKNILFYNHYQKTDIDLNKRKFIFTLKINLLELITSLIEEGNSNNPYINTLKQIIEVFSPIDLFEDSIKSMNILINQYINKNQIINFEKNIRNKNSIEKEIINRLLNLYKFNQDFQKSIELKWSLRVYYYIKILSDIYDRTEVKQYLNNLKYNDKNINKNYSLINDEDKSNKLLRTKLIMFNNENQINEKNKIEINSFIIYKFLNKLLTRIEISENINSNKNNKKSYSFFVIPPICFLLSKQTKKDFNENVDRDSTHSKICSLINETDYFIFEMFLNNFNFRDYKKFSKFLLKINIFHLEKFNYLLIIAHNILLFIHFYSINEINESIKFKVNDYNYYLCLFHIAFIIFVIFIWFYFTFKLQFIHNLMRNYNIKLTFRSLDDKTSHLTSMTENPHKMVNKIYKQVTLLQRINTFFFDSILMNRKINMFIYTLILLHLYIFTGNSIFLAFPMLFIANIIEILFGLVLIIKERGDQLILTLIYTYLIVYIYAIVSFYYFQDNFVFKNLYNIEYKINNVEENFCNSILQCYLTLLSYGVRSGGGIGDVLMKLSYRGNIREYRGRILYDILFHLIIVLIMINLLFGIIYDSYQSFRNKKNEIKFDKKNICFICQMSRGFAINKNVDFNQHRKTVHNYWNYVYFLTYLHINNENNFKKLESNVWNKLLESDTSWIPLNEEEVEDEIKNEKKALKIEGINLKMCFFIKNDINKEIKEIYMEYILNLNNVLFQSLLCLNNKIKNVEDINTYKNKIKIWIEQDCQKDFYYFNEIEKIKEILIICDNIKIPYFKILNEDVITKKTKLLQRRQSKMLSFLEKITLLCIGPEESNKIKEYFGKFMKSEKKIIFN